MVNIIFSGQSNANRMLWAETGSSIHQVKIGSDSAYNPPIGWTPPTLNTYYTIPSIGLAALANTIGDLTGEDVKIAHNARSGSDIGSWGSAGSNFTNLANIVEPDSAYFVWIQGEADAALGTSKSAYKAALDQLFSDVKDVTNDDIVFVMVQINGHPTAPQGQIDTIKEAQLEWIDETDGVIFGGKLSDHSIDTDGTHLTNNTAGVGKMGEAIGLAIAADMLAGSFRATAVRRMYDVNLPNSTAVFVPWQAVLNNKEKIWSATHPTRLTVPSGVSKVRLLVAGSTDPNANGRRNYSVYKNGGDWYGMPESNQRAPQTGGFRLPMMSLVVPAVEGDYFELRAFQDSGSNLALSANPRTWFAMEIVE